MRCYNLGFHSAIASSFVTRVVEKVSSVLSLFPYKYRQLAAPNATVRLLRIERKNGTISQDLIHIETNKLSETQYAALSYRWYYDNQDRDQRYKCQLHNGYLWITTNLNDFLLEFSANVANNTSEYIYIDALCINQASEVEKANQILLMRKIYSNAKKTIIWLGTALGDERLAQHHYGLYQRLYDNIEPEYRDFVYDAVVRCIYNHSYWERLWIVQECLLAGDTEIWCDRKSIFQWKDIDRLIQKLDVGDETYRVGWTPYEKKARNLFNTKRELYDTLHPQPHGSGPYIFGLSMRDTLRRFGGQKCLDKRDKVYGLLGIIEDHSIEVRYDAAWDIGKVIIQVMEQVWKEISEEVVEDADISTSSPLTDYNEFLRFALDECFRPSGEVERHVLSVSSFIPPAQPTHFTGTQRSRWSTTYRAARNSSPPYA